MSWASEKDGLDQRFIHAINSRVECSFGILNTLMVKTAVCLLLFYALKDRGCFLRKAQFASQLQVSNAYNRDDALGYFFYTDNVTWDQVSNSAKNRRQSDPSNMPSGASSGVA